MISNQILQSTLDGLKAIARVELCVIDVDGKTAATTADGLEEYLPQARAFVDSPADSQEVQGNQFFAVPPGGGRWKSPDRDPGLSLG